jgi:DNA-binding CsgD family transcriptional regulator
VQKNKAILELQARYEKVKKEKEISELQESMLRQKNNTRLSIIGLLIFIILLTVTGFTLFFQRRKAVYDKRLTSKKNELLGLKIELKDKELVNKSMHLANASQTTVNLATMIQDRITTADKDTQAILLNIIKDIEPTSPQSSWKEFDIRFEQVYEGFYKTLFSKHPDLTPAEIRLCSFMRLNMSSKDIAILTSRSIRTIENTRNNIRRKMNLGNNINLTTYLISL